MDLTTVSAVKLQLGINTTTDDALIALYVSQASRFVESYCQRRFSHFTGTLCYDLRHVSKGGRFTSDTLYFTTDVLKVDALYTNGSLIPSSEYRLLPTDDGFQYSQYFPRYAIQLSPIRGWLVEGVLASNGLNTIEVVGTFGYCLASERPPDIVLATTKLAAWLYQNRDNTGAPVQLDNGSITMPAEVPQFVLKTLTRYVRTEVFF